MHSVCFSYVGKGICTNPPPPHLPPSPPPPPVKVRTEQTLLPFNRICSSSLFFYWSNMVMFGLKETVARDQNGFKYWRQPTNSYRAFSSISQDPLGGAAVALKFKGSVLKYYNALILYAPRSSGGVKIKQTLLEIVLSYPPPPSTTPKERLLIETHTHRPFVVIGSHHTHTVS